jgi:hypothetical protein
MIFRGPHSIAPVPYGLTANTGCRPGHSISPGPGEVLFVDDLLQPSHGRAV